MHRPDVAASCLDGERGALGLEAAAAEAAASPGSALRHLRKGPMPMLLDTVSSTLLGGMLAACMPARCEHSAGRECVKGLMYRILPLEGGHTQDAASIRQVKAKKIGNFQFLALQPS